jgi:hypothetical protein
MQVIGGVQMGHNVCNGVALPVAAWFVRPYA